MVERDHPRTLSDKQHRSVLPGRVLITASQIGRSISGSRKITKRLPKLFFGFSYYDFFAAWITYHRVGDSIQVHWIQTRLPANILRVLGIRRRGVHPDQPATKAGATANKILKIRRAILSSAHRMPVVLVRASTCKEPRHRDKQDGPNSRRRQTPPESEYRNIQLRENPPAQNCAHQPQHNISQAPESAATRNLPRQPPGQQADENPV